MCVVLVVYVEVGKLFDFDFMLLIIVMEFLLLMMIFDKMVFGLVGKVFDDCDEFI